MPDDGKLLKSVVCVWVFELFDREKISFSRVHRVVKVQDKLDQLLSTVPILELDQEVVLQPRLAITVDSQAVDNLKAEQQLTATKAMEAMVKLLLTDNSRKQQVVISSPAALFLFGFVYYKLPLFISGLLQAGNNRSCLLIDVHIIQRVEKNASCYSFFFSPLYSPSILF